MDQAAPRAKRARDDDDSPHIPRHHTTSSRDSYETQLTLTSVAVVCRPHPRVVSISDVVQSIDSFVGSDAKWTALTVCKADLPGFEAKDKSNLAAIRTGNVEWVVKLGAPVFDADTRIAAKSGHVPILEWLGNVKELPLGPCLETFAIENGHLQAVKWLATQPGVNLAVLGHHLRNAPATLVAWALANVDVTLKKNLAKCINIAASRNDLELVKLLHGSSNGGSGTTDAMDNAVMAGHLEMVKWLHANRSEGCTTNAMDDAAIGGHLDVVKWLHTHRPEGCTTAAMDLAARFGSFKMIKWLHTNRVEGCTTRPMDEAAGSEHLDIVQWLHDHHTEGSTADAMVKAALKGHIQVVQWLVETGRGQVTWEEANLAIDANKLKVVEWMLLLLPGDYDAHQIARARSLDVARLPQADGQFPLGSKDYCCALMSGRWQFFQWLLREYPDAMLTLAELERVVIESDYGDIRR